MRRLFLLVLLSLPAVAQVPADCIRILSLEETNELDQDHSVCPDENGLVSLKKGGTREVNGIPDHEMAELVRDDELYAGCIDIFGAPPFAPALEEIARRRNSTAREALAFVFDSLTWQWHPFEPASRDGAKIYACVELSPLREGRPAAVHLYRSMCRATAIYDVRLGRLNLGTQFQTIAAHEVGHVIDELSGCAASFSADAETRATVYGLAISQCNARRWQALFATLAENPGSGHPELPERVRQLTLSCLGAKWGVMEREVAAVRDQLVRAPSSATSPLAAVSACASAAGDGRSIPQLDRCPVRGE
jgi:hypothetical protein